MGQGLIFQRTYKAKDGTVKTCKTWTIRWYRNGLAHEEATKFTRKGEALNLLKLRNGDVAKGKPITAAHFKPTFDEAAQTVLNDYTANGKRSLDDVKRRIEKHLTPVFGGRRLSDISSDHVLAYITTRQEKGASNATINRELAVLKRGFSLALKHGKIFTKPNIPMLRESAPRAGFFDRDQVEAVYRHLPTKLQNLVRFCFITGWRMKSEAQPIEWHQVDFAAGTVSLLPGTTKNGQGRTFKFTADLRTLLEVQQSYREQLAKRSILCPYVFHRHGRTIKGFRKAWQKACLAAGLPGRIPHDLRRSSIRVMVRAGLSEHAAMQLAGHKTPSVFRRYDTTRRT